jgi:hypothetical protein
MAKKTVILMSATGKTSSWPVAPRTKTIDEHATRRKLASKGVVFA